jgi:GNAT superfamily N-acetyltransferase
LRAAGFGYGRGVLSRVEISRATPSEHRAILALHREAGWPGTHVDGDVWAARVAGEVVGSVQVIEIAPRLMLIDAAVVQARSRGRGIGTAMVTAVLATQEALWWLECRAERIAFYERLGFSAEHDAPVPAIVRARVGVNSARRQFFLRQSTISP